MARYVYNDGMLNEVDKKGNKISNNISTAPSGIKLPTAKSNNVLNYNINTRDSNNLINPQATVNSIKKVNNDKYFKKSNALSDGYDFGDITKTTLSTIGDAGVNVVKGATNILEGATDLATYTGAGIASLLGADDTAKKWKESAANNSWSNDLFEPITKKIDQNSILGNKSDAVAQGVGYYAGMVGLQALGVPWQLTAGVTSAGNSLSESFSEGASTGEAIKYALASTAAEIGSEYMFSGLGKLTGTGALDDVAINGITKRFKNQYIKTLADFGLKSAGEGIEEIVSGWINEIAKQTTYMKEEDKNILQNAWQGTKDYFTQQAAADFWNGTLVSAISGIAMPGEGNLINNLRNAKNINTQQTNIIENNTIENQEQINSAETKTSTENSKINNLRNTAIKYNINQDLVNVAEKIISDKNYNIIFDDTITNDNGNMVNAQITTLENGEIEIRLNPNSERAGEFLLVHEITHSIANDSMKQLVLDYANKNAEFNKALNELKQTYKTEDVTEEVLADISGQLFGNQEFINNLSVEQPSIFKQIYAKIIELVNKITGNTKEALFIRNLQDKWENAYRLQNNNLNGINYSYIGIKGADNLQNNNANHSNTKNLLGIAKFIHNNSTETLENTNRKSIEETGWFKDKNGAWKYEIDDSKATIDLNNVKANVEYDLKDILKHQELFDAYPELNDLKVKFVKMKNGSGEYVANKKLIKINDNKLNNIKSQKKINSVKATILHETQHLIQITEGFELEAHNFLDIDGYIHDLGEIEGQDVRDRIEYSEKQRKEKLPESAKDNPIHSQAKQLKNSGNNVVKTARKVYNAVKGRGFYEITEGNNLDDSKSFENQTRDNSGIRQLRRGRGLENSSFSLKQKQLDIILKNNPVEDDYHTWIRSIDDIKTLEEALNDGDWSDYDEFNPDLTKQDIEEAINTGKITVYSSYPIEQGIFVSPSRMEAESYSANGKIYSKKVEINDVAWIDPTQGQYAKVNNNLYSQQTNKWQEHLEKNYKATGTRTNLTNSKSKTMNPLEISKLTKEDAHTTPILKKINVSKGDGESKFASNINNKTDMLNQKSKDLILSSDDVRFYEKVTNKESLEKAFERLNKNGKNETENWLRKDSENATSVDVAEGWILLKQYQDSINTENDLNAKNELNRSMVEIAKKLREIGTKAGQTVQAFNILNRLTPEGMVYYAQSELSEAYEKMSKNKTKEWIDSNRDKFEITPEETQFIMDTMKEVQQMEDGYDKRVKLAEIQKLMTDKLPPARGAGIKSWMRISMLFNPKTQVRNVMGNAVIAPVNSFSDLFANIVDKQIAKKTGIRTTGKTNIKNYTKGFKTGLYQSYNDFKKGINTRNMQGNRFEVTEGKSFNDNSKIGRQLNKIDSLLSFMLDAGDRGFYEASFTNSINNQMILNNTTEVSQDMIDIATSEALSRTWQDNNNYTKFVLQTRNALNKINIKGYGLGDVLIPFAKTPANLTKAIIDYSPLGMINAINSGKNLKNSLSNGQYTAQMQHQFVQNLGKATAGTMLYILGYALAKAGITSGESDDDKDTKDFMKNTLGVSSYSIKIGGKTFTYDWAQPVAAPLSIMANIVNKQKEGTTLTENIISSLDTAGNILLEQSFMESINTVLNNNDGIVTGIQEAILELPSRAIPTLMKQIVDLTDDTQRTTFEYDKPLKTSINKIKAKIPGLSTTLSPVVDTIGREVQRYGGKNNIFNVFLNPANVNTENISESAEEIYRVYKSTGDKTVMPRVIPYYFNEDGVKKTLTSKERSEFQKISGKIIEDNVSNLLNNINYVNMSDIDKSTVLNNIVNYAYNKARYEMFGTEMSNVYNKVNEWTSQGGSISDYYANKGENDYFLENPKKYNTMVSFDLSYDDYNKFSQEINSLKSQYNDTNLRKQAVWQYIQNQKLTKVQKILLYKLCGGYSISNYKDYMFNYINNQNITKTEKQEIWKYLYE